MVSESKESNINAAPTVLVVEDDPPLLEFVSFLLKREGYRILVAGNGVEALDLANGSPDEPIDILLSDVAMPYMGGGQLAEILREIRPGIRVLLISALPIQEVLNRCGPSAMNEFLPKPFSVSDLTGRLRQLAEAA